MALITEASMVNIEREIEKQNRNLRAFVDLYATSTWDTVQLDVKTMTPAALLLKYPIGTELTCHYTVGANTYDFVWVVLDVRECTWQDGTKHTGLWLGAKYCTIEDIQFDAAEDTLVNLSEETTAVDGWYYWGLTGTTYTALNLSAGDTIPTTYDSVHKCGINDLNVLRYGYNRYRDCAQRQWLNSAEPAGDWWASTHLGDKAPSQLSQRDGFMKGFDSDFLAVLHPVKVDVATNTVTDGGVTDTMYDTFFLQSRSEMYGDQGLATIEGAYFPYWKNVTGYENPTDGSSTNTNNARKIPRISDPAGSAANVRLPSANRGYSNYVWFVHSAGYLGNYFATISYAALPACVIS